jgi:hypothetical protein
VFNKPAESARMVPDDPGGIVHAIASLTRRSGGSRSAYPTRVYGDHISGAKGANMKPNVVVSMALSVVALALLTLQLVATGGHVDGWVVGLLAIAFLPWLWPVVESIAFPGGSIKFRELKEKQKVQEHDIRALQFVTAHLLTESEKSYLRRIANGETIKASLGVLIPDEVMRLRSLGFVTSPPYELEVNDISDIGRQYLELADRADQQAKARQPSLAKPHEPPE